LFLILSLKFEIVDFVSFGMNNFLIDIYKINYNIFLKL